MYDSAHDAMTLDRALPMLDAEGVARRRQTMAAIRQYECEGAQIEEMAAETRAMDRVRCSENLLESELLSMIQMLRGRIHQAMPEEERLKDSTNPLTLFGHWGSEKSAEFWKRMPERITPAQMLGQFIAICVIVASLPLVLVARTLENLLTSEWPASNE